MTHETTDTKAPTKRRRSKKTSKKKNAAPALVGCCFAERGCDAERIHEWDRAREEVRGLLRAGKITLCDRHKACLDGPQPKEEDDDEPTDDD
jgi:hypothetical protein